MSIKYLTHAAVIRCTHGGLLQLFPPLRRSLWSGGSPVIVEADLFAGKIIGCPQPFKPCINIVQILTGLAEKTIVDGQIPILMTLQAVTDAGAFCSAEFDPVTNLETEGGAVPLVRSPSLAKDSWWRGQWNDVIRMFTDPASLTGLLFGLVLAILAVLLVPAGLSGLALVLLTLGAAALIGIFSAFAATVVGNLRNGLPWNSNILRGMLHGAGIGIAFAGAGIALEAAGLAVGSIGFIAAMAAVGAAIGIISNKLAGRPWDESLLANGVVAAGFAKLGRFLPKWQTAEVADEGTTVEDAVGTAGRRSPTGPFKGLPRTPEATNEAHNVETAIEEINNEPKPPTKFGKDRAQSITAMRHEDGTVSVGVSGITEDEAAMIQDRLNKTTPGKYRVRGTVDEELGIELEPVPGRKIPTINCSETRAASAANESDSPPMDYDTIHRAKASPNQWPLGDSEFPERKAPCDNCSYPPNAARIDDHAKIPSNDSTAGGGPAVVPFFPRRAPDEEDDDELD